MSCACPRDDPLDCARARYGDADESCECICHYEDDAGNDAIQAARGWRVGALVEARPSCGLLRLRTCPSDAPESAKGTCRGTSVSHAAPNCGT